MGIKCLSCEMVRPLHTAGCDMAEPGDVPATPAVVGILTAAEDLSPEELGQIIAGISMLAISKAIIGGMEGMGGA